MQVYEIVLSDKASDDLEKLARSEPKVYDKAILLLEQMTTSPYKGLGKPEALKGNLSGFWSRKISKKHRIVYRVDEEEVIIGVIRSYGHYDDK